MPPLSARSLVASLLLGSQPPELPVAFLVRTGELFGIGGPAVRTAISRMTAAGELETSGEARYRLAGPLVGRQLRQAEGRRASRRSWNGTWILAVVAGGPRSTNDRAALRSAAADLRMAELREGVWTRPDNLGFPGDRLPEVLSDQCEIYRSAQPDDPVGLAGSLWDLGEWSRRARALDQRLSEDLASAAAIDPRALPPAFELAAATVRHLAVDPLLPDPLLPADWPGASLRARYDDYERAFRRSLAGWYRQWRRGDP